MGSYQKSKNLCASLLAILWFIPGSAAAYSGTVVDASTCKPIPGAFVTLGNTVVRTSQDGRFQIGGEGTVLGLRAYGYGRSEIPVGELKGSETLPLAPFRPRALYLSAYGVANLRLRESALDLIGKTGLNAVVIDVKNERGRIAYQTGVPLAAEVGAQKNVTIKHIRRLIDALHKAGIYVIARIVVFKDNILALAKPGWAVRTASGAIWKDREGIAWTDPFVKQVWDYNLDIAAAAAGDGFDEIQFDYVRFPEAKGLVFSEPNTEKNRIAAISGFLAAARKRLVPYNVFLSADIFGYVIWNRNDTGIGQSLKDWLEMSIISPPCSILRVSSMVSRVIPTPSVTRARWFTFHCARPRRGRDCLRFASVPGCRRFGITLLVGNPSRVGRSRRRSTRRRLSERMAGCYGIPAMSIRRQDSLQSQERGWMGMAALHIGTGICSRNVVEDVASHVQ